MITGIKKISFYDPATGTTVQLNNISPDSQIKIREPYAIERMDGAMVYSGEESIVEVTAFDSFPTQLETWMDNETDLNMVALGFDTHILWYENAPITVKRNLNPAVGNRNSFTIKIEKKGGIHNIHAGNNLLYLATGWKDEAIPTGKVDDWTFEGNWSSYSFSSNIQSLEGDVAITGLGMYYPLVFPIEGAIFNFFNNIGGSTGSVSAGSVQIIEKNYAGTALQTKSNNALSTVLSITTGPGCYTLLCELITGAEFSALATITFEDPYLGNKSNGKIRY